jgi:hypothetical protein
VRKQRDLFVDFWWPVAKHGYQWVEAKPPAEAETQLLLVPRSAAISEYRPLKSNTGLFREFVALEQTPEGVLKFANRYGELGIPKQMDVSNKPEAQYGELFSDWCKQIRAMQYPAANWDRFRAGNLEQIAKALPVDTGHSTPQIEQLIYLLPSDLGNDPTARHYNSDSADRSRPVSIAGRILSAIATQVNRRLQDAEVSPKLLYDRRIGKLIMHVVPDKLLGALWLQFARTIDGEKEHRSCPGCDRWFEVSPGQGRSDKEYCSGACRARAYRERKEQACQMRADGKLPSEIAKDLDVDLSQVRRWLKASKKKG